jgi:hypothetical protein
VADSDLRSPQDREPVRFLVFSASLRADSLNGRLACLVAEAIEANGRAVDFRPMSDFDAPSYDADVQNGDGIPHGSKACLHRAPSLPVPMPDQAGGSRVRRRTRGQGPSRRPPVGHR